MPLNLNDAEQIKNVIVTPTIEAMRAEFTQHLAPLIEAQRASDAAIQANTLDIQALKDNQKKALLGFGVYASVAAAAVGSLWGYFTSKIHWS